MDSTPIHRKIELQSRADLSYLESLLRTHTQRKLDLHLPPVAPTTTTTTSTSGAPTHPAPEAEDPLRAKTAEYMHIFIDRVIRGMRMNVQINGMDVSDSGLGGAHHMDTGSPGETEEEYEDLDQKLRDRLRATIARRDLLIAKIAQHRRTTGRAAAASFQERFLAEGEKWDAAIKEAEEKAMVQQQEGGNAVLDAVELKRREEVERTYERAVRGLGSLDTGLAETRARLERAGSVVGYLEGERGRGRKVEA
ncbi:uncharacterized protein EI97DRAFT_421407 [Westerdykella ornata]|uniref:Uncharacterized protein n=1 Tax=Westerdykella ornata TaxID=318751 RepID=A0A6A6JEZ8_WESOR|nr:uncharacterized protein EI97DRAFT_421407 [Westerdykella ornata]KAF2274814.1 hypothetical protein EI97DRAFT_421407 [Westerdykella ornata]